ncbi:MAG TPA: NAD(P)H-dependent oxidoreductase subunit E, partial [Streptosporangiaceae bacterium]|nr:NAD(P)H-dependent oxidoreductase subunit E [Streptosporangiaceae bacterium]
MPFSDEVRARLDPDAGQIIARYPRSRSALLPLLHLVQSEEGHVSDDGIDYCADRLGLAESEVASVVSFYTMFKRNPVGEYHVGVCTNTLCAIMGGDQILAD